MLAEIDSMVTVLPGLYLQKRKVIVKVKNRKHRKKSINMKVIKLSPKDYKLLYLPVCEGHHDVEGGQGEHNMEQGPGVGHSVIFIRVASTKNRD